jgi:hypothetical protein
MFDMAMEPQLHKIFLALSHIRNLRTFASTTQSHPDILRFIKQYLKDPVIVQETKAPLL